MNRDDYHDAGNDATVAYLHHHVQRLLRPEPPQRRTFTAENPHTCAQCEQEVTNGFPFDNKFGSQMWYLKQNLEGAVHSAQSGCSFYDAMLDFLMFDKKVPAWAFDKSERGRVRFLLWIHPTDEPWSVNFYIHFGESSSGLHRVGPNWLDVWTRERGKSLLKNISSQQPSIG
jgi:hypothetical protein